MKFWEERSLEMKKEDIAKYLDQHSEELYSIAQSLYDSPEISGAEEYSSAKFKIKLKEQGFTLHEFEEEELKYAFYAEYGHGHPVVALLGEYDALPGLSQVGGASKKQSAEEGGPGHACGHNLIGTAAYAGAVAAKKYLEETGKEGTIRFYGCPQEELLDGKVIMAKHRAFDGCDTAISFHPWDANLPVYQGFLAMNNMKFHFQGISAHAGQAPEQGRSALDAVELANMGVNVMREHIISSARIHYIITNGGEAPNIVPREASSWYYVRAPHRSDVREITQRVLNCQKGAALMTDTTLEVEQVGGCYEILPNDVMFNLAAKNFQEMPLPVYTQEEQALAKALTESLSKDLVQKERERIDFQEEADYVHSRVVPLDLAKKYPITGSSDIGDVSWLMPFSTLFTAAWPLGVNAHTWQSASASGSSLGQKGMLYAAKIMAGMFSDLVSHPEILKQAQEEFQKRTQGNAYVSPLL